MEDASPEEMKNAMERWNAFDDEATQSGALTASEPLENSSAAMTGSIEIRPVMDLPQFGYESKTLTPAKAWV